jgi:Ca-activated chloride channel family protein
MGFQYIQYLFLLAAVPLLVALFLFVLNRKKKTIKKIGDERLVKALIKNYSPAKFSLKFILLVLAFIFGVFALANLRTSRGTEKVTRNGIDVMIALDVSKSMLAQDIKPTRLDRAKQVLSRLIDKLGNDRIGIVVFAGRAYLQMPLTGDHGAAKMYLSSATTDMVPTQGTVISEALKMCAAAFNSKEKKYKTVVLISDGEDHDEAALTTAGQLAEEGIMINTIGIGSPGGSTIIDAVTNEVKKDNDGNVVISKLNEEELNSIAKKANGIYQIFTNTEEVVSALSGRLSTMDQRTVTEDSLTNYKSFFQWFLLAALVLLLAEIFISENIGGLQRRSTGLQKPPFKISPFSVTKFLCIFCILLPVFGFGQQENATIKKGNEAYNKQEFEKAAEQYQKVITHSPANEAALFNLGNALYKNNKADEAVTAFDNTLLNTTNKTTRSQAYYNKGVVLQHNKKLAECIEAYKNALKLDPQDEDARQNLQKALHQQKQQQKQEEDKKKNKPKEDEKQKEKQKPKEEDEKKDQPKPLPSKISRQDAEEKLKSLLQQEKNLQDKLRKVKSASMGKPEKDW